MKKRARNDFLLEKCDYFNVNSNLSWVLHHPKRWGMNIFWVEKKISIENLPSFSIQLQTMEKKSLENLLLKVNWKKEEVFAVLKSEFFMNSKKKLSAKEITRRIFSLDMIAIHMKIYWEHEQNMKNPFLHSPQLLMRIFIAIIESCLVFSISIFIF